MTNELIRLTDDESAKAIQELAKFGSKAIDSGAGFGRYLDRVFGRVPDNLVGFLFGDWLEEKRIRNADRLRAETEEIRRRRGTDKQAEISPSIAIPLVLAAIDEEREKLRELWARLLANAMDPTRTSRVRAAFIDAVKSMEPLDAVVLTRVQERGGALDGTLRNSLAAELRVGRDELDVSALNLVKIGMMSETHSPNAAVTPLGREFLRAIEL